MKSDRIPTGHDEKDIKQKGKKGHYIFNRHEQKAGNAEKAERCNRKTL